jgi:hypothetical protein
MVTFFELVPRVAVIAAFWSLGMLLSPVALNVAVVAPEATVTDAGTVTRGLSLPSVTLAPPVRAAWLSVTVQVLTSL